jgi:dethiobiotin synthetase
MHHFITGTDTGAGKTYITRLLLEGLKREGIAAVGFKPFCSGDRDDAVQLLRASAPGFTLEEINPLWFKTPAAPLAASMIEGRPVDLDFVRACYEKLRSRAEVVLVEGVGGWEVPLTAPATCADFAQSLGLPVLVVVNNRLGALNHTLLTVDNIRARGMTCTGIVLNHVADERDPASISNRVILGLVRPELRILADVMHEESELDALGILRPGS